MNKLFHEKTKGGRAQNSSGTGWRHSLEPVPRLPDRRRTRRSLSPTAWAKPMPAGWAIRIRWRYRQAEIQARRTQRVAPGLLALARAGKPAIARNSALRAHGYNLQQPKQPLAVFLRRIKHVRKIAPAIDHALDAHGALHHAEKNCVVPHGGHACPFPDVGTELIKQGRALDHAELGADMS